MTIHLTPLPHDTDSETVMGSEPARRAAHLIVVIASILAGIALALVLTRKGGIDPVLAAFAGAGFCAWAGLMHWIVTRPLRARIEPQPQRKKRRERRQHGDAGTNTQAVEKSAEPSDQALMLRARAERGGASKPPATEPAETAQTEAVQTALVQTIAGAILPARAEQPSIDAHTLSAPARVWPPLAQVPVTAPVEAPANPCGHPTIPTAAETEFERVERLVKRLADNVNQLEAAQSQAPAGAQLMLDLSGDPASELAASISALKRANPAPLPAGSGPQLIAAPAMEGAGPDRLSDTHAVSQRAQILSALNAQRIDVFLEPILDLVAQRPQHYEVSIALLTANGTAINLAEAARDLSGTGLLPLIDSVRIARASQMARRLAERGKAGAVFTELNGETLNDGGFQDAFATPQRPVGAFPGQLVLTLPQSHVMTFTTADWHTLDRLAEAGFGFALSDVTTLDMDFANLAAQGFTFARLDAESFLIGLPMATATVPPADICRHLAACGLALIVGGIVEDHQLARIFGFGVLFGQGLLFGGPRAVKPQATTLSVAAAE